MTGLIDEDFLEECGIRGVSVDDIQFCVNNADGRLRVIANDEVPAWMLGSRVFAGLRPDENLAFLDYRPDENPTFRESIKVEGESSTAEIRNYRIRGRCSASVFKTRVEEFYSSIRDKLVKVDSDAYQTSKHSWTTMFRVRPGTDSAWMGGDFPVLLAEREADIPMEHEGLLDIKAPEGVGQRSRRDIDEQD